MTLILIFGLIYMDYIFIRNLIQFEDKFGTPQWLMLAGAIVSVPLLVFLGIRAYKENQVNKAKREEEMKKLEEENKKKKKSIYDVDFDRDSDPDSPNFNIDIPVSAAEYDDLTEVDDIEPEDLSGDPTESRIPRGKARSKFDE